MFKYTNTNGHLAHNAVVKDYRDGYDKVWRLDSSEYLFDVQSSVLMWKCARGYVLTTGTEELNCIQFIFGRRLMLFHRCSFLVKANSRGLSPACGASRKIKSSLHPVAYTNP